MADAVSKLYAEIGFKINQTQLKDAKKAVEELAQKLSAINNATKEAAKEYGIFSKREATQRRQSFNEKKKLLKEEEDAQKRAYRDRIRTDKLISKHEEQQNKEAEKYAKQRVARLKGMSNAFKNFAISVSTALVGVAGSALAMTEESRQRAINIRDFQFETGIGFEDLQRYRRQFNILGSGLSAEDIMGDLSSVQQNLIDISLGKGNLAGYKLAGIKAGGSASDVVEALRQKAQEPGITNAMLINILKQMGFRNATSWLMNLRNITGDDTRTKQSQISAEQETSILQAEISLRQFNEAVRNAKDQVTASVSPLFNELATSWKRAIEDFSIGMKNLSPETEGFRKGLESLIKSTDALISAFGKLVELYIKALPYVEKLTSWIADELFPDRNPTEGYANAKQIEKNILEWGRKGFKGLKEGEFSDELMAQEMFGRSIANAKKFYETFQARDRIGEFNNDRRISGRVNFNQVDAHTNNVTINGVYQDELKDEMVNAIKEENQKSNKDYWTEDFYKVSDLWVLAPAGGNVSTR